VKISGIPNYRDLDVSGESRAAARRMEDRAVAPASQAMFDALVAPLLDPRSRTVLEVGCGTAALSRRIARLLPGSTVHATDKSEGMLAAAREYAEADRSGGGGELVLGRWDVLDPAAFPFEPGDGFDAILSSVMVPYLDDRRTTALVRDLASRLAPDGTLAFVEQDLTTDTVNFPDFDLLRRVYARDERDLKQTVALGLRPLLREAGLDLLPRRSFLWTDDRYLPYTRELLARIADDALGSDRITPAERERWTETLESLAATGDFYYGIVYHLVAGRAPVA
jgi:SAM-dependent methyltransferase